MTASAGFSDACLRGLGRPEGRLDVLAQVAMLEGGAGVFFEGMGVKLGVVVRSGKWQLLRLRFQPRPAISLRLREPDRDPAAHTTCANKRGDKP
jgi:hypothetical protein